MVSRLAPGLLRQPHPLSSLQWTLFALIVVAGAVIRFAFLGSIPPGLWYDEALYALDGYRVSQGYFAWFFDEHGHPREPLFPWMLGAAFALIEPTVLVARGVSAACGSLAVALFLPVARRFLPAGWALAATAAFAAFRWHIHFSRTIFRAGLSAPLVLLTLWMFLRWRENRRPLDAALCGMSAGLCLYTYISLRIVPLLLLVWILTMLYTRAVSLRSVWRHATLMFATTAVVFLPLLFDYVQNPSHVTGRTDEITMFEKDVEVTRSDGSAGVQRVRKTAGEVVSGLADNARGVALVWFVRGDYVPRHGVPYRPVFDPVTGLVFAAGFVLVLGSVFRYGRRDLDESGKECAGGLLGPVILLTWFGGFCAASIFSFGAPNILRIQGAQPVVILMMILGLKWALERLPSVVTPAVRSVVAGLVLFVFAALQLNDYFRVFPADLRVRSAFGADFFYAPAKAADDIAPGVDMVYVPQEFLDSLQVRFTTIRRDNVVGYGPDEPLPGLDGDPALSGAWLVTGRSLQLAAGAGQDHGAQLDAAAEMVQKERFFLPVGDENGRLIQRQPWAELWVRAGGNGQ